MAHRKRPCGQHHNERGSDEGWGYRSGQRRLSMILRPISCTTHTNFFSQVCEIIWARPGASAPMHRTRSIDYGVVLEGQIELELDNGDRRLLKTGYSNVLQWCWNLAHVSLGM